MELKPCPFCGSKAELVHIRGAWELEKHTSREVDE